MSIYFDTLGERAHTSSVARSTCPMSITCWVKCSGTWNDWSDPITIQYNGDTGNYHALFITWEVATPSEILKVYASSRKDAGTGYNAQTPGGFPFDEWHFIAGVWDGSGNTATSRKVRLDNGPTYTESTSVTPTGSTPALTIGSRAPASTFNQFYGSIAHAALWNKALSDDELLELYSVRPPNASFAASLAQYYPFVSGDLYNETVNNYDLTSSGSPSYSSDEPTFRTARGGPLIHPNAGAAGLGVSYGRGTGI